MDLRSDRPYWPRTCRRPSLASARSHRVHVDALIVGAGVTGAFVAYQLIEAGASVALLDRRPVGAGSTPASTALLQYELDRSLVELSGLLGRAHARAAYSASHRTLREMKRVCGALGGDLEFAPRRSLHLAVKPADVRTLRREVAARRALRIPVELLSRVDLRARFELDRPGAILSEDAFEVNPLKLTYRLLQSARKRGAVLLPRTRVDLSDLGKTDRPFRLELPSGRRLVARHVVLATGYETPEQFREVACLTELRSTFALATQPLGGTESMRSTAPRRATAPRVAPRPLRNEPWPERALLWEMGDPYFYARTTADGRIMVGGEDEPFTTPAARDKLIASKSRTLMRKLRELIPARRVTPAFRWAGTFAQTQDGLPYIGQHQRWPGVFFALGYGGNGITFSLLAAKIIAAAITGKPHPAARLFTFER